MPCQRGAWGARGAQKGSAEAAMPGPGVRGARELAGRPEETEGTEQEGLGGGPRWGQGALGRAPLGRPVCQP